MVHLSIFIRLIGPKAKDSKVDNRVHGFLQVVLTENPAQYPKQRLLPVEAHLSYWLLNYRKNNDRENIQYQNFRTSRLLFEVCLLASYDGIKQWWRVEVRLWTRMAIQRRMALSYWTNNLQKWPLQMKLASEQHTDLLKNA